MGRYSLERDQENRFDLESFELAIRSSMHQVGQSMLEVFIHANGGDYRGKTVSDGDGHRYDFIEFRNKQLTTVLGLMTVKRAYYCKRESGKGYCPKDRVLDIEGTSYSSGVRRMMGKVGACRSFALGSEDMHELAGIVVSAKEVERVSQMVGDQAESFHQAEAAASLSGNIVPIKPVPKLYVCMDGTGIPVVKKETLGRAKKNCINGRKTAARNSMMDTRNL